MAGAGGDEALAEEGSGASAPVLRISQLDAFELDAALEQLVWSQFSQCFQHFKPGLLTPVEPELKALLQLLLWRFTVYSHGATAGQSLLNIRYRNAQLGARRFRPMSRGQKLRLALCTVGEGWLRERAHSLFLGLPAESRLLHKARRALAGLAGLAKLAGLVNFLLFLQRGAFPSLTERLLGVRAEFRRPRAARDVSFHHVNRELLWHGFAEFLIFLLPLAKAWKLRARAGGPDGPRGTECGLCGEWPTMPHAAPCGHVFCYYCAKSHAIADIYLTCPKCGVEAPSVEPLQLQVNLAETLQG
ncbi:peroxisome biogenesis factor 2 [Denticeps clupeoides]|uniref:Peroxisome biogenesis factor 2 n=1 Tax=Denticeps clupeoides TaxID=299321 RepID=A0AAY4A7M8_9TELE|nr:peroxisome biogenesis factor 2 [Denticeps clupeoides]